MSGADKERAPARARAGALYRMAGQARGGKWAAGRISQLARRPLVPGAQSMPPPGRLRFSQLREKCRAAVGGDPARTTTERSRQCSIAPGRSGGKHPNTMATGQRRLAVRQKAPSFRWAGLKSKSPRGSLDCFRIQAIPGSKDWFQKKDRAKTRTPQG